MPGGGSALARCVGDPDEFLATTFERTPIARPDADVLGLLGLADVDRLISESGLRRPAVRLVREGTPVDPVIWTRSVRTGSVPVPDLVDAVKVVEQFRNGATVVLQSMQRWWPPIGRFCRELEAALGHAVQANAYLTPAGAVGLAPHHDTHDVFVLQLHGSKHWIVREPLVESPLTRHRSSAVDAAAQPVLFEIDLEPGACLYLPRGVVHSAATHDGTSLHLTIGILATTRHDVVRRVAAMAADSPRFRSSLPVGWSDDPQVAAAAVRTTIDELVGYLRGVDADAVGRELAGRYRASRVPPTAGALLDLDQLDRLADDTAVVRRSGIALTSTVAGERLLLGFDRRTMDLPRAVAPATDRLLDGDTHLVGEIADLMDQASRLVLVRRLIADGLLRIVGK